MARYARVDDPLASEFPIGVTHPDDPKAAPGQWLRPLPDEEQVVKAEDLKGFEDALDGEGEDAKLKEGYYALDDSRYLGRNRPPPEPEPA